MNPLSFSEYRVLFRGGGELASGAIRRLHLSKFPVLVLEIEKPLCVRRTVSFANAVYECFWEIEGVSSAQVPSVSAALKVMKKGIVPVLVDPEGKSFAEFHPTILVDARMAKKNLNTKATDAPVVIALGPGFTAPQDAHFVVETARGHDLGRVITTGSALPDTGIPGEVGKETVNRVLRSPATGVFQGKRKIGDFVQKDEVVAVVSGVPVTAKISGVLRGLLHDTVTVVEGQKVGDVDPRSDPSFCYRISDKANAIAGGVMEAALRGMATLAVSPP